VAGRHRGVGGGRLDEQHLGGAARRSAAVDPGRDDAGVVDDHHRLGRQVIDQRREPRVDQRIAHHQQPRAVAGRRRRLRDLPGRQLEREVGLGVHGAGLGRTTPAPPQAPR
jgi:hypothetical protein